MKLFSFISCFLLCIIISAALINADNCLVPGPVKDAFKEGNTQVISGYCCENVELSIFGKEGQYTKEKFEEALKEFFEKHTPRLFVIIFEGGKECSQYAIGKLTTDKGAYRINLIIKSGVIQQVKIEMYNED